MTGLDLSVYIDREFEGQLITQDLLNYLTTLYKSKVRILAKRYEGKWEPSSKTFTDFLLSKGVTRRYPDLLSLIERSVIVRRMMTNYILGIDPRKYYPNSRVRLIDYVRFIELGTSTDQARPLLSIIKRDLETNFKKYYLDVVGGNDN